MVGSWIGLQDQQIIDTLNLAGDLNGIANEVDDAIVDGLPFPFLGQNIFDKEWDEPAFDPYTWFERGGAKIAVFLDLVGGDDQLGKDLAMHIAASKPKALDNSGVPAELLETERRIAIEKARADNKPEAMLEKIAEGTVQKYLKDVTLLAQVFVKAEDGKQTVEQLVKAKGASVAGFTLYVVGEGLEKRSNDFAAEVAAQPPAAAQK